MFAVVLFCVVKNTIGNYDNIPGADIVDLVVDEICTAPLEDEIYLKKAVIMWPR